MVILTGTVIWLFFAACKNNKAPERKIYTRNTGITKQNAYNNLFLDSAALEHFITQQNLNDAAAEAMRSFYYSRNFEFAWFARYSVAEQGREFWNLASYNTTTLKDTVAYYKALNKKMPDITAEDTVWASAKDTGFVKTELMLTDAFIRNITQNGSRKVTTQQLGRYLPAEKKDVLDAAAAELKSSDEVPLNDEAKQAYGQLKLELKKYYEAAQKGGWQTIAYTGKRIKKGETSSIMPAVKYRLKATGEYNSSDTSTLFDTLLYDAVKKIEKSFGYKADGIITDSLIKDINVPARKRVQQLLVNLNRIKWTPQPAKGRLITTNIPEYILHVFEDKKKAFDMDVVVGKQSSATVVFTGNLTTIVFSPFWNIPPSIIKKEILPKMQDDTGYLTKQNMEIKGYKNGLPVVRQLPGANNSLGRVKFIFNNSYNIYFHDTPAKDIFNRRKRAYSHGCIRLSDPVKMAAYLLNFDTSWTKEKITAAMNSPTEIYAPLKHSVPVIITYYTAWVDEAGILNFRDDIYGHDAEVAAKIFTNPE